MNALLPRFQAAGVVSAPDIAITRGLAELGGVDPEGEVGLALALCLRALRSGSVCLDLGADPSIWETADDEGAAGSGPAAVAAAAEPTPDDPLPWPAPQAWVQAVAACPLVNVGPEAPGERPLRLVGGLLYLTRYWMDELLVRRFLAGAAETQGGPPPAGPPPAGSVLAPHGAQTPTVAAAVQAVFGDGQRSRQGDAVAASISNRVTIVAGGPGTGKTTTVASMIAAAHMLDRDIRVMLAAPTGKAAARLSEAVAREIVGLPGGLGDFPVPMARTIHRMLGWRSGYRNRFRHDRYNPLPVDLVIVDEASMVSLPLMARLLDAVPPGARVVLVGDPDQLASVEAGAVLADLVAAPGDLPVVELDHTWRFGGVIADLAAAIRAGDADAVVAVLQRDDPALSWYQPDPDASEERTASQSGLVDDVVACDRAVRCAAVAGQSAAALVALDSHRLLCAHRDGRYGASHWDALACTWVDVRTSPERLALGASDPGSWPVGQPILVTANDYATELFNGDTGVIVATPDGPRAAFGRGAQPLLISPSRLSGAVALRAMTVHRSQGSQFDTVSVILPGPQSPILTRELLYTAATRAKARVRLIGTEEAVRAAVTRRVIRASGLRSAWEPGAR